MKQAGARLFGGIELGGTNTVVAVGGGDEALLALEKFPTTGPRETLQRAARFLGQQAARHGPLSGIGIGTFGPVATDPRTPDWGRIGNTPKPGWPGTDLRAELGRHLDVPLVIDTDVNAALIGEARWGAGRGLDDIVYLTVGTGIGGGVLSGGRVVRGAGHTEIGHMRIPVHEEDRDFPGVCPAHGRCAEGLASGTSLSRRWGPDVADLPPDHQAWVLEAAYLAALCLNLYMAFAPRRIVLGGGVMQQTHLFDPIRTGFLRLMGDFIPVDAGRLIAPTRLAGRAGALGACALAADPLRAGLNHRRDTQP